MSGLLTYVLVANYALALLAVARVLSRRRDPTSMLAWILAILSIPVLGLTAYWLLGSGRLGRKMGRRRRRVARLVARSRGWDSLPAGTGVPTAGVSAEEEGIASLGQRLTGMPVVGGNEVRILQEANATYAALEESLRAAKHHIHLEYYIWQPDETGRAFRDLVIEMARAGVECRLLLDAVGCWRLSRGFLRPLVEAGVEVAFFMPLRLFPLSKRWSMHLRNHRKIAVIDGQTALLGSQNIGDEYRGRLAPLSPWYDTHLRVSGPAALFVQQTFVEDWSLATRRWLDGPGYFPVPPRPGNSALQVLPTGPDQNTQALTQLLFAAVSSAQSSIRISTPYFVPDPATRLALEHACYRGVQVRLVLPTRSDSRLSLWAARSFYAELLDAGVQIHEYDQGVLHSKLVTVDDRWCMVGSANMDARSFRLNFEVTALIYDDHLVSELAASIDSFCARSRTITRREVHRQPSWRQLSEGAARLFAPLL